MALAGIPIPETQCIGDSLDTINNAFQALDTAVAAAAGAGVTQIVAGSNISISPTGGTGVVTINGSASYTLPCRLGENSCTITNWNDAITNGWYMGSDATNAPGAGWYMGYVQARNAGWTTQIIHQFAGNNSTWIREQNNSVWGSWTPYGGASVTVSDTPPSGASAGDLWFDSSSGVTSVYYDSTWVDVGGGDSGTSAGSVNGIVKSDGSGNFSAAVPDIDYALPLPGRIVQSVFDTDNTRITSDANVYIPFDDTIPQITEGKEYLSVTLTPRSSTSKIFLLSHVVCGITSGGDFTVAAFRSGQTDALIAMRGISYYNNGFNLLVVDTPNTTSPVTYSIRIGGELATSAVCFNMLWSIQKYGNPGAFRSTLFALEIQ